MIAPAGVTPLSDGGFDFDPLLLSCFREDPDGAAKQLGLAALPSTVWVPVYAWLLDLPTGPILIDAGAGGMLGDGLGGVHAALTAVGIAPGQVAAVALTHLHGDHCGGLLAEDGAPAFPNARILVPETELEFWIDGATTGGVEEIARDAARALAPYDPEPVAPGWQGLGLQAIAAPGHTPGHTAWAVPALSALASGDIWHLAALQAGRPDCFSDWDMDRAAAWSSRRDLSARSAAAGWSMLCAHAGIVTLEAGSGSGRAATFTDPGRH